MLVGHVGVALLVKQAEPRMSLGTAIAAATIADVLLFSFILLGVEHVQFRTSGAIAPYFSPVNLWSSHSMVLTALGGAACAGAYAWRHGRGAGAWLLAAAVIGHWVLDLLSYQPFLPVFPRQETYIGWSLHGSTAIAIVVEAVLWAGAIVLYVRDSRSTHSAGRYVFWGGVAAWTYVTWANMAGAPRKADDAPIEMLILLAMMIGWGYWMNRARAMKQGAGAPPTIAAPSTY